MLYFTIRFIKNKFLDAIMTSNLLKGSKLMQIAYDRFLRTLSNKTRLAVIQALRGNPKNVTQLTKEMGIHQTSVSHALKRLLDCGFVLLERNGKEHIYSVNKKTIQPLMKLMEAHINNYCAKCDVNKK